MHRHNNTSGACQENPRACNATDLKGNHLQIPS